MNLDLDSSTCPTLTTAQLQEQALAAGNYEDYLMLFDSHERLRPLMGIVQLLTDAQYWQLVRAAWMTAEATHRERETWRALFTANRSAKEHLMDDEEHVALEQLPTRVRIYRGCGNDEGIYGMSWTLDRDLAKRFAVLAHGLRRLALGEAPTEIKPTIAEGWCRKEQVLAHFTARSEAEIVISPENVTVERAEQWSWPPRRRSAMVGGCG